MTVHVTTGRISGSSSNSGSSGFCASAPYSAADRAADATWIAGTSLSPQREGARGPTPRTTAAKRPRDRVCKHLERPLELAPALLCRPLQRRAPLLHRPPRSPRPRPRLDPARGARNRGKVADEGVRDRHPRVPPRLPQLVRGGNGHELPLQLVALQPELWADRQRLRGHALQVRVDVLQGGGVGGQRRRDDRPVVLQLAMGGRVIVMPPPPLFCIENH